jgi:hypothetical protein
MNRPSRQAVVLGGFAVLAVTGTLVVLLAKPRGADIGFWFDPISADTLATLPERLGGELTAAEMKTIESVAVQEISYAFRDFKVGLSERRDATYRVRVVDSLRYPIAPRMPAPSAESRSIPGLGGQGAVNFRLIAHSAIMFAPPELNRQAMVEGIGRGIGRAAVHEFAHQFLGSAPIHESKDIKSYEYRSADRVEQYYGEVRWDIARPLLEKRIGLKSPLARRQPSPRSPG